MIFNIKEIVIICIKGITFFTRILWSRIVILFSYLFILLSYHKIPTIVFADRYLMQPLTKGLGHTKNILSSSRWAEQFITNGQKLLNLPTVHDNFGNPELGLMGLGRGPDRETKQIPLTCGWGLLN